MWATEITSLVFISPNCAFYQLLAVLALCYLRWLWIHCPEGVQLLGVPHGDVASHAIRVPYSYKDAESEGHLVQLSLPLCDKGDMFRDAGKGCPLGKQLQRRLAGVAVRLLWGNILLCQRSHLLCLFRVSLQIVRKATQPWRSPGVVQGFVLLPSGEEDFRQDTRWRR